MIRRLIAVYTVRGPAGVYRWASARLHLALSDVLGRWAMWHTQMARLVVEDEVGRPADD